MRDATAGAAAVVLAGGSGSRVGPGGNKVYLPLAGRPMIVWSLLACAGVPGIAPVVLVVRAADREPAERLLAAEPELAGVEMVIGGDTRQASELAALRHLADRIHEGALDVVLVHDGARPMAGPGLVARVLAAAREDGGAVPGLPRDDLAVAGVDAAGRAVLVSRAPDGLVAVQTPQGFRAAPLLAAYERAAGCGFVGTDTASCVQRFAPELPIRTIAGEQSNFKVTYPDDVALAERVIDRVVPARPRIPAPPLTRP
jgi:2-C-methyl-D-erythritol 4-phosphate cytidylyltransferase